MSASPLVPNPMFDPSRRKFLSISAAGTLGLLGSSCVWGIVPQGTASNKLTSARRQAPVSADSTENVLEAFIVSDAHFGFQNVQQPSPWQVSYMIDRIRAIFPNLHLFCDTGDGHHNTASDEDRANWTRFLADRVGPIPMLYCGGNHDAINFSGSESPELRTAKWASVPGPLYYAFDLRGVHFLVLPQLLSYGYLTREALDWADLDLMAHREQTTIILSHNAIPGTTLPHDDLGYRRVTNGEAIRELIRQHPQVVAWMHGHNHTVEVVPRDGVLYVSNGRIGGFSPPYPGEYGYGHLGGIYVRVQTDGVLVRAFSASARRFFDYFSNMAHMSGFLQTPTSVDAHAPAALSTGFGGAADGETKRLHRHYVGSASRAAVWARPAAPTINENATLDHFTQRTNISWRRKDLIGFHVTPAEEDEIFVDRSWEWLNPGLRILPNSKVKHVFAPSLSQGKAYYPVPPGIDLQARCQLIADQAGPQVRLRLRLLEPNGNTYATLASPLTVLDAQATELIEDFAVAGYTHPSGETLRAVIELELQNLSAGVNIYRLELRFADADKPMQTAKMTYGGSTFDLPIDSAAALTVPLNGAADQAVSTTCDGSRRLSWLLQESDLQWQVRNAVAQQAGDELLLGPMRSPYAADRMVIAPLANTGGLAWVSLLEGVNRAVIRLANDIDREVRITVTEAAGDAFAEFRGPVPTEIIGGQSVSSTGGVTRVQLNPDVGRTTIYRF